MRDNLKRIGYIKPEPDTDEGGGAEVDARLEAEETSGTEPEEEDAEVEEEESPSSEDTADDDHDDDYDDSAASRTSSNSSYSYGGDSSASSGRDAEIGVGTFIILGIVALLAFAAMNSQPAGNYRPVAPVNPSPPPMPQRSYPPARSEGGVVMSLQGSWPDGYTATKTIVVPDSGFSKIDEQIRVGDDLEIILQPLWMIDFETIGDTLEIAVDEGGGFKSLNELTIEHRLISREQGKPWLLKRRIIRFHRTDGNSWQYGPLLCGIHKITMTEITRMRKSD